MLTCVPLHGFQRSSAAALCDLTTEVLRTINATENAMVEYGLAQAHERSYLVGTDVKQADDAFRELEENVRSQHELHVLFCLKHDRFAAVSNRAEYLWNKLFPDWLQQQQTTSSRFHGD